MFGKIVDGRETVSASAPEKPSRFQKNVRKWWFVPRNDPGRREVALERVRGRFEELLLFGRERTRQHDLGQLDAVTARDEAHRRQSPSSGSRLDRGTARADEHVGDAARQRSAREGFVRGIAPGAARRAALRTNGVIDEYASTKPREGFLSRSDPREKSRGSVAAAGCRFRRVDALDGAAARG